MMGAMERHVQGLVFNIQRFCIHDGPGVRTTVYIKGCSLRCNWCSNPESWNTFPEIMPFDKKCIKCGACIQVCPNNAISWVNGARTIKWEECNQCLRCSEVCPAKAIEQIGFNISPHELLQEIEKDRIFYDLSEGGVTFSGGEPLVQWEFVLNALKLCKQHGIHTALDTTGNIRPDIFVQVLEFVDLMLYDVKHLNPQLHIERTGVDNQLILENLNNVKKVNPHTKLWIRVPVIPGFNDSPEYAIDLVNLAANTDADKISLMPYHSLGDHKFERLGRTYPLKGIPALQKVDVEEQQKILVNAGLSVSIGS